MVLDNTNGQMDLVTLVILETVWRAVKANWKNCKIINLTHTMVSFLKIKKMVLAFFSGRVVIPMRVIILMIREVAMV
jgi:hypothetical protein